MGINDLLINKKFVSKVDYKNNMYVTMLFQSIYDLLKELPIPVVASYDPKNIQVYFIFVDNKKSFAIDENIAIEDYLTLVRRWSSKFFPKYVVKSKQEVSLSKDEIFKKVEEKVKIEDAIELTKEVEIIENGIINSIYLSEDLFRMSINGDNRIFHSNKMMLSKFLEILKDIETDEGKRDFIFDNSMIITGEDPLDFVYNKVTYFKERTNIKIEYKEKKMYNFFSINYPDLKNFQLKEISNLVYEWDKYEIHFDNDEIEKMCLGYVEKKNNG